MNSTPLRLQERRGKVAHIVLLAASATIVLGASYEGTLTWRLNAEVRRLQTQPTRVAFASGTDLIVYVFMSSKCHFCTSDSATKAIRGLRAAVRRAAGTR